MQKKIYTLLAKAGEQRKKGLGIQQQMRLSMLNGNIQNYVSGGFYETRGFG